MSRFALLTVLLLAAVFVGEGECKGKNKEKRQQCMQQTKQMKSCCPFPKNEEMTGECKEHLEGIESKEEKDKWHAMSCFSDCYYKSKGMINEAGELQVNQMKTETNNILDANDGADFKDISMKSIDYCNTAIAAMKEKWDKKKNDNKDGDEKKEPKCNFLPSAMSMCFISNVVRNCPAAKWTNTPECDAIKSNATSMEDCMKN